jgi:predicted transcriptional regulator
MKTSVIRVQVNEEMAAALKKFANETERSVSASIRLAIQRLLESHEQGAPE